MSAIIVAGHMPLLSQEAYRRHFCAISPVREACPTLAEGVK